MNTEIEVLKNFWENNGKTHLRLISNQTGFGTDYVFYLCKYLAKKGEIKSVKGKWDWYSITAQGKKRLKLAGIIKPKVSRKVNEVEKIIWYLPKKLKARPSEPDLQKFSKKGSLIKAEEEKLNLGKKIERAVSFLKKL